MIRVGLVLPSFRMDADTALDTAVLADEQGLDGVFVYDHLFPMGQPERPAISCFPLLGAVAASTRRVSIGPLVARIGLVPNAVLVNEFVALGRIAPGRIIAALGTGDSKSRPEHDAYGLPFPTAEERLETLRDAVRMLLGRGFEVWTSGSTSTAQQVALDLGVRHNFWGSTAEVVAAAAVPVTWAGPPQQEPQEFADHLTALEEAGASWAVYGPPPSADWPKVVEKLAGARR